MTSRLRISSEVILRIMIEGIELILADPAAFLVAQRRVELVYLEPGANAGRVVLVDEQHNSGGVRCRVFRSAPAAARLLGAHS